MTIVEPVWSETVIIWLINAVCSTVCSQIHKSLYFLLGINYWAMHFGHYFLTFAVLFVLSLAGLFQRQSIPLRAALPLAATEFFVSAAACIVHSAGSDGTVYTIRVTDFAVTLLIVVLAKYFIDGKHFSFAGSPNLFLVVIIAISSSVAWFEPIINISFLIVGVVWPMVTISTALHFMLVFETAQKLNISPINLSFNVCGWTSLIMGPFALIFTTDKFTQDTQDVASSWELIDYLVILMSCVFVSGMMVTRYMLLCKLSPESYAVARHSKYLLAGLGQWLLHNLEHITAVSIAGKSVAAIAIASYLFQRRKQARELTESATRTLV